MKNFQGIIKIVCIAAVLCIAVSGIALSEEKKTVDLSKFSCKYVMRLSGTDRDVAIGIVHAFLLGKKGTTVFNPDTLATATDEFIDYCLDNPKANALDTMEKFVK